MSYRDALLAAIAANLYEDTPRLALADWLDERGEHARAEFIRVQVELEPIRDQYELPRAAELHARERDFGSRGLHQHDEARAWLGAMPPEWDDWRKAIKLEFRRGFPDTLALPARTFLELGAELRHLHPTIRRVVLFRVNGYGERIASCPALEGLAELELACWYHPQDAEAIAQSAHLKQLQVLVFWLGTVWYGQPDVRTCRIFGASKAWPNLRELTLLNPYAEKERTRKKLVTTLNKAAGREIAVYRVGYPALFPFAPDFWYAFPGFLPNGRMALGIEDHRTNPPGLCVITFDKRGKQTKEVIRVPAPDELLAVPTDAWFQHKDRLQQQLVDVLGFTPGFIRIRDCRFPNDEHQYNSPSPEMIGELGQLDTDDEASWDQFPEGFGGRAWRDVHTGEWVFGWDRYGDKSGRIHST